VVSRFGPVADVDEIVSEWMTGVLAEVDVLIALESEIEIGEPQRVQATAAKGVLADV